MASCVNGVTRRQGTPDSKSSTRTDGHTGANQPSGNGGRMTKRHVVTSSALLLQLLTNQFVPTPSMSPPIPTWSACHVSARRDSWWIR